MECPLSRAYADLVIWSLKLSPVTPLLRHSASIRLLLPRFNFCNPFPPFVYFATTYRASDRLLLGTIIVAALGTQFSRLKGPVGDANRSEPNRSDPNSTAPNRTLIFPQEFVAKAHSLSAL
jgi:hypothetical protein